MPALIFLWFFSVKSLVYGAFLKEKLFSYFRSQFGGLEASAEERKT
jgi:hypothetical protein